MGSLWEHMPPNAAGEVMEHLKWDRRALVVFRKTSKGLRDAHDRRVTRLSVAGCRSALPSSLILGTRFPIVAEIGVRFHTGCCFRNTFYDDTFYEDTFYNWLRALASLPTLTRLDLAYCEQVSDHVLLGLVGLTAFTSLDLSYCQEVSDNGLHALAGLTALTAALRTAPGPATRRPASPLGGRPCCPARRAAGW
jgi:hypothetical protein